MKKLTVAHVLSSFEIGGQERLALDLATWQRQHGYNVLAVSLAAPPDGPNAANFRAASIETATVAKGPGVDTGLPFRLAKLMTERGVDLVHTHNPHALIYGAPAAGIARIKSVHTKHGMNPDLPRRLWLRRAASTLVDAYVAVTPTLARVARETRECDPARVHVVANGVDVERFRPDPQARAEVRAELGIPSDAWVVGTVGRLAPEKDQALLVRAMAPLLDERRQLVIVGDGPAREALAATVAGTWRAEFCHLLGARPDVERCIAAFDAFALTSLTEGLPLVLLEAMAMGLPVVSTAVGGIPDLISSGASGFLVEPGNEQQLFRRLLYLNTYPTAGLRFGESGRELVHAKYSLGCMAERYQTLYERVVVRQAERQAAPLPATAGE
jgi:glycosyltransferase involved in cell wall biosynthesis